MSIKLRINIYTLTNVPFLICHSRAHTVFCLHTMTQSESKLDIDEENDLPISTNVKCIEAVANSVKLNKLSSAIFCMNDDDELIQIVEFIGNPSWIGIGHIIINNHNKNDIKCFVFKEEMLYLMECGCCELIIEYKINNNDNNDNNKKIQTCIGLQNTFTLFLSLQNDLSFNFNIYSVFKKLKSMNYIVKRTHLLSNNNNNNKWNNYLISSQSELSKYFECTYFWIWKRGNNQWWRAFQQGFQNNTIKSIAASFRKLYQEKPDSLVLIKKNNSENINNKTNFIHSIIDNIDNIPIIVATASQNDVLLFKFQSTNLLD